MPATDEVYKTCDICKCETNSSLDILLFGDWQCSRDINVHYFCLLLSTHLPQHGQDNRGINGFLVRDIRSEISAAAKRKCCFCLKPHASIRCYKCKEYFHITCGRTNRCLFQFCNEFRSYCDACIPVEELNPKGLQIKRWTHERCTICRDQMGSYDPVRSIHGVCCGSGFAHSVCVQKYALASGYYLRCIWCRSKDFRETVRLQGIFVPDRDAQWERQPGAYRDLHVGHRRCDMETCWCPKGRDYVTGKWSIILCTLCGGIGAHNPRCIPGKGNSKRPVEIFKCSICANTEKMTIRQNEKQKQPTMHKNDCDLIDPTIFMNKKSIDCVSDAMEETITFSDDSSAHCSEASVITVIPRNERHRNVKSTGVFDTANINNENNCLSAEATTITLDPSPSEIINSQVVAAEAILETQLPYIRLNDDSNYESTKISTTDEINLLDNTNSLCSTPKKIASSPEISHSSEQNEMSGSTQSPISTSQEQDEAFKTFDVYEYDMEAHKCIGTATVCINMNDERFAGRTLEEIQRMTEILTEEDVIARSDDTGIFGFIDRVITQFE